MLPILLVMGKFLLLAGLIAGAAFLIIKNWTPIKAFFTDLFTEPLQNIKDMVKFAGKISGVSSLLGLGDDTDEKLKAQGFKIQEPGEAIGDPTGSKELTKKSFEYKERQTKSSVDVNFSNMPKDTRVITDDKESILNVMSGMMGAT